MKMPKVKGGRTYPFMIIKSDFCATSDVKTKTDSCYSNMQFLHSRCNYGIEISLPLLLVEILSQIVVVELVMEGAQPDAQYLGRLSPTTAGLLQRLDDGLLFEVFQVE